MRNTRFVAAAAIVLVGFASSAAIGYEADAEALVDQFAPIERGSYRLATVGADVSMRLDADYWMVQDDHVGMTVFSDPGPEGSRSRDVILVVPSRLAATGAARLTSDVAMDIDAWLDTVDDRVLSRRTSGARVGGRRAMRFDIDLTTAGQPEALEFLSTAAGDRVSFEPGRMYNVWWFDGDDPIAVIAASDGAAHPFLYQAEQLVAGLAFADAR